MKKPSIAVSSLLGIIFFISPLLLASWDVWSKTIIHFLTIITAITFIFCCTPDAPERLITHIPKYLKLFFACLLISSLLSQIKFNTEFELHNWLNYLLVFMMVYLLPLELLKKTQKYFISAVSIIIGYSIFQIYSRKAAMPDSTMVNPNILAGYLLMAIPMLYASRIGKNPPYRLFIIALFLLSVFILLLTKSFSGIIALFSAVIIIKYRWKGALVSGAIFLFLLSFKLKEPDVVNRYLWWQSCLNIIRDNPIFGTGPGTFQFVYPRYKSSLLSSMFAHNYYLQLCSEIGIPGLMFFIIFIFASFKKITNNYVKTALLAVLIQNIFEYNLIILANGILFWALLAFAIRPAENGGISFHDYKQPDRDNLRPLLIRCLFVMALIIYSNGVFKIYQSTKYFNQAENSYASADMGLSEQYLLKAKTLKPDFWQAYDKLSHVYLEKFSKTRLQSYLYRALSNSETTNRLNPYFRYYYAKKTA